LSALFSNQALIFYFFSIVHGVVTFDTLSFIEPLHFKDVIFELALGVFEC